MKTKISPYMDVTEERSPQKKSDNGQPGSMLPVVTDAMPDKVQQYRWGLLTDEDDVIHSKHKHARIEMLDKIPIWKNLLGSHHCVIRIQAFFEYSKEHKKLYRIERKDGKPLYIAGLWDIWMDIPTSLLVPTFVMITVPPNSEMSKIHDRMPAILERGDIKRWLNSSYLGKERKEYIQGRPCPADILKISTDPAR